MSFLFRNDINNKKIYIILTFLGLSVFGAIVLSFMNVHYDFLELHNFYRGYMGRRLLIQEGRLLTRRHEEKVKQNKVESSFFCSAWSIFLLYLSIWIFLEWNLRPCKWQETWYL